jgi:hypothetical protein
MVVHLPPFPSSPVIFDGIGLVHVSFAPESFRGPKDQMLIIRSWELRPDGCRLGIDAVYHPNSKTVYDRGLLLP